MRGADCRQNSALPRRYATPSTSTSMPSPGSMYTPSRRSGAVVRSNAAPSGWSLRRSSARQLHRARSIEAVEWLHGHEFRHAARQRAGLVEDHAATRQPFEHVCARDHESRAGAARASQR